MRSRVVVLLLFAGLPFSPLSAQRVISPDSLRPPLVLDSSPDVRLMTAVRLQILQLEQAIQRADTLQLMRVLGDAEIPAAEAALARQRGCASLGWALKEMRRARARAASGSGLPLDRLAIRVMELSVAPDGSASAALMVRDVASPRRDYADFRLEFERRGDAVVLKRSLGLRAALCGLALTP
jgi:hypothetical protein